MDGLQLDPDRSSSASQAAAALGVPAETLRCWERAGLLAPVGRDAGRRRYRTEDLGLLDVILCLRLTGMPVRGVRASSDLARSGPATRLPEHDIRGRQPDWLTWCTDGRPTPDSLARAEGVREILTAGGGSPAQGAPAWVWAHHARAVPLPGLRDSAQVEENTGALHAAPVTADEHEQIETVLGRTPARDTA